MNDNWFSLYNDEKEKLNKLIELHKGHESGGITPERYRVVFVSTSVVFVPLFECYCGYGESLMGEERINSI